MASGVNCSTKDCPNRTQIYRQCADNQCKKEVAYCKACGGDDRALNEMAEHIKAHKEAAQ